MGRKLVASRVRSHPMLNPMGSVFESLFRLSDFPAAITSQFIAKRCAPMYISGGYIPSFLHSGVSKIMHTWKAFFEERSSLRKGPGFTPPAWWTYRQEALARHAGVYTTERKDAGQQQSRCRDAAGDSPTRSCGTVRSTLAASAAPVCVCVT